MDPTEGNNSKSSYEETVNLIKFCELGNDETHEVYRRSIVQSTNDILLTTHDLHEKTSRTKNIHPIMISTKEDDHLIPQHEIPEYGRDDHVGTLDFISTCSPNSIWDCLRSTLKKFDVLIDYDDKWILEGSTTVDGDVLHIRVALYKGPGTAYTIGLDLVKGDLNQFITLMDKLRSNCKEIDNFEDFPFGKSGSDALWSGDDMDELYPGSMDMPEDEIHLLMLEMTSPSHPSTKCQAAKALALATKSKANCLFLTNQQGYIESLLTLTQDDDQDLQRFALYILMRVSQNEGCPCRKEIQKAALRCFPSVTSSDASTQKLVETWLKEIHEDGNN